MLSHSTVLGILSEYFPLSTMATGVECAEEVLNFVNADIAATNFNTPEVTVVNDVNVIAPVKVADETSRRIVADLIVLHYIDKKITCIKEYRGAFPNESLKSSKDAIEDAYLRNGMSLSGRFVYDESNEDTTLTHETLSRTEPLDPWS